MARAALQPLCCACLVFGVVSRDAVLQLMYHEQSSAVDENDTALQKLYGMHAMRMQACTVVMPLVDPVMEPLG